MKGTYILLVYLPESLTIATRFKMSFDLKPGYYAYVGSAMNGIERRLRRYLQKNKKMFWHIDYLLNHASINAIFAINSPQKLECYVAGELIKHLTPVDGFGCSDCSCKSHLFYSRDKKKMLNKLLNCINDIDTKK